METIAVAFDEDLARFVRSQAERTQRDEAQVVRDLLMFGFEQRLKQAYEKFERGEIGLGGIALELNLTLRETYDLLEHRGLPTSNISLANKESG